MNQRKWTGRLLLAASMAAMTVPAAAAPPSASPFASPSSLPYQAPDFTRIKDSDFLPAFDGAMAEQKAEIARIANSPAPPTFGNTLIAMERSGVMLRRVQSVFGVLSQTDSTPEREAIQKAVAPKFAAHSDAIYLNPKLFARVKAVYDKRDQLHLPPSNSSSPRLSTSASSAPARSFRPTTRRSSGQSTPSSRRFRPHSARSCSPPPRRADLSSTIRRRSRA